MSKLPPGWALATVNDLIASDGLFADGDWVETKDQDPSGSVRLTQLADVGDGTWRDRSNRFLTADAAERLGCTFLTAGDVLVARMPDPLGRACLFPGASQPCVTVVDVAVLRPGAASVSAKWVMWVINSPAMRSAIEAQQAGTTRRRVSRKNLGSLVLAIPPRPEQERIVTAIEEAFSKLDAGEAGLRIACQRLKRMRDAVLAAAATGVLVPQDPNDRPAAEMLAEIGVEPIAEAGDLPYLPKGWAWATMGNLAHGSGYGTSAKCGYDENGVGVLRIPNIQGGAVDLSDLKRAPAAARIGDDLYLRDGDLLIVRTNGSRDLIGRCAPVTRELGCSFASYLIRFQMHAEVVDVRYLSLMLSSQRWRQRLEDGAASSAGQYNLSLRTLAPLPVAMPPMEEQRRIVAETERQMSFIEACERAVDVGMARANALRRAVLKAAFEGRLVPQDRADEPASVLLDRIRAARAEQPAPTRRRRAAKS